MSALTDEFIKSLSREELEQTTIKLRNELSELSGELTFWRSKAEESQKREGKVLTRSSITEEMLNELNNIAGKISNMEINSSRNSTSLISDNNLSHGRNSMANLKSSSMLPDLSSPVAPVPFTPSPPPPLPTSSALKSEIQLNSSQKAFTYGKSNNVLTKKAPPKMSKAEFMKRYEAKNSSADFKSNLASKSSNKATDTNSKSRVSLQWGCSHEEYPLFTDDVDKRTLRDYFSELDKKASQLLNSEDLNGEHYRLKMSSNSIFTLASEDSENTVSIPKEKLFEWFIKKKDESKISGFTSTGKNNDVGSSILSDNADENGCGFSNRDNAVSGHAVDENGTVKESTINKNNEEKKAIDVNANEERQSLFCSKTSRMLQITINYFKKKLPKSQHKNLLMFKQSILKCTLDKEGVNLLLETVPDPVENPCKYEIWRECVTTVENYLKNKPRESLLEEEEFVYFLSRIPNLSKRLECMILRSSFEQLYNESLKWISEKIQGLELILNHKRLPLLFKSIIDSRNIINQRLNEMNNNQDIASVKYIPLSSIKKLNSLRSPNIKGKTLMNFISSVVGEIFNDDELSILKKSSEKNISIIYTMVTDLLFSWLDLRDNTNSLVFGKLQDNCSTEDGDDLKDEFDVIMASFYSEKYDQMIRLSSDFRYLLRLYVASCYYFGDVRTFLPINMKLGHDRQDLIDYLMDFIKKYNSALNQEAMNKGSEEVSPTSGNAFEIKKKALANVREANNQFGPKLNTHGGTSAEIKTHLSNGVENSGSDTKVNIKELFAKSIVKELNLKPLFNRRGNANLGNGNSESSDDIEKTVSLSDKLSFNASNFTQSDISGDSLLDGGKVRRSSVLKLSDEAMEILSRSNDLVLNSSLDFEDNSGNDSEISDSDTIALSSPSSTKLLDIHDLAGFGTDLNTRTTADVDQESSKKKKVVIMAEDVYSPVKQNSRFNRRQSIKRMCQIAAYLDSSSCQNDAEADGKGNVSVQSNTDRLDAYKSPVPKNVKFYGCYNGGFEHSNCDETNDTLVDPDLYTKTCILNEVFDLNNLNKENSPCYNDYTDHSRDLAECATSTPEKTISSRRKKKYGATISPHN